MAVAIEGLERTMHSLLVRCRGTEGTGDSRRRAKGIIQPDTNPAAPLTNLALYMPVFALLDRLKRRGIP